jgi:hypothetical protein
MSEAPERELARALEHGLRSDFGDRSKTALHLAELLLDAVDEALSLASGKGDSAALELLAQRADVYAWDGPPGWDVVLARGIAERGAADVPASPLDGLGAADDRAEQRAAAQEQLRVEAQRLVELGREAAQLDSASGSSATELTAHPTLPPGGVLVAVHASLLRLLALSAASRLLDLPEDLQAGQLPPPGLSGLIAEMDARAISGSDFSAAHDEWLARLLHKNPAASDPAFRTFFAGMSQWLRVAVALRAWRDEALGGQLSADLEPVVGAVGAWQPERWQALRHGVPSAWMRQLCPPQPDVARYAQLARECELALDLIGRLWAAEGLSLTGFAALATLLFARTCSALALREQLG